MRVLRSLGQDGLSILTPARVFARLNRRRTTAALQRRSKASAGPRPVDPYLPQRALAPFQTQASRIIDPVREVALDCVIRWPAGASGPLPLVVYSVPMDWSPANPTADAGYLAEHLAAAGYMAVTVRHPGTDRLVYPQYPAERRDRAYYGLDRADDPASQVHRINDLRFLLDVIARWNEAGPFHGLIDLERIGMSGHSFGGLATMALAGQRVGPGLDSYRDERVRAVATYGIMCSSPASPPAMFADITIPTLYIVGAGDHTYGRWYMPSDKLLGFRLCDAPHRYAVMLDLDDHHTYPGGRTVAGKATAGELLCQQWTRSIALAFWDAWLMDDDCARVWLERDLSGLLSDNGQFWRK